jgi:hypothetical protein
MKRLMCCIKIVLIRRVLARKEYSQFFMNVLLLHTKETNFIYLRNKYNSIYTFISIIKLYVKIDDIKLNNNQPLYRGSL